MIEYNHLYHLYCHFSMFSRILFSNTSVWYVVIKKTLAVFFQNIKFCKAPNTVNFRNILYLNHFFVGEFPPFWPSNLISGEIPKDTKKTTNSQHFVYELVG